MIENRLFEALLDIIPFGAYAVDIETFEVVYINKFMAEHMYDSKKCHCWEALFGQEQMCSWCNISKLQSRKSRDKVICEFFDESNDTWQKSYDELMSWPDGRDVKYSILVDITDQKEIQGSMVKSHANLAVKTKELSKMNKNLQSAKIELQKSIEQFEKLLNSTIEGVIIVRDGKCIDINNQALKLLGFLNKEEVLDREFFSFIDDEFLNLSKLSISKYNTPWESLMVKKDDSTFPTLLQTVPLTEDSIVVSIIDLSELKQKDKVIHEQKKMVALGEMMSNIAHHWRQPLNSITVSASGLQLKKEIDSLEDKEFYEYTNNIIRSSKYLSSTIEEFTHFIKDDKTTKVYDLGKLLEKTINFIEGEIAKNSIEIVVDIKEEVLMYSHMNELKQLLLNIINNSIDALEKCSEKRMILITHKVDEKYVVLEIQDSAKGVDNSIIDKIFEPYFTTKHKSVGTGLGLYMVHKIIESIGGDITIKNRAFKYKCSELMGACVTLKLPRS